MVESVEVSSRISGATPCELDQRRQPETHLARANRHSCLRLRELLPRRRHGQRRDQLRASDAPTGRGDERRDRLRSFYRRFYSYRALNPLSIGYSSSGVALLLGRGLEIRFLDALHRESLGALGDDKLVEGRGASPTLCGNSPRLPANHRLLPALHE